jgi:hypothetical protein
MAPLLMMGWGALLLGALWLKAGRPHRSALPPAQDWANQHDSKEVQLPPPWALALLLPLCLWFVAAGAGQSRREPAHLAAYIALGIIVWASVLCLAASRDGRSTG